ncbi:MAG: glutamine--tRNA ligase/YqeY domain fusion protein [Candidatus Marinimicrobia bacterium]|nr:glutamine--tRNA ligase/YqeY domain fusion protein [Candidatus Neomarinimicrobiota bacterium]
MKKENTNSESTNFIHQIIDRDLLEGKNDSRVHTRFPPEPNGYLHIGHAKAIVLSFSTAEKYGGLCNLRFDDTNPVKEEDEFVDSIKDNLRWLGYDWKDRCYFASDYFGKMYEYAVDLIKKGSAFVCDLDAEEIREYRGTPTKSGKNSPYRDRSVEENLELFQKMRDGEFPNGAKTLRAKIDMSSSNMNMRDPIMYRIIHAKHNNVGDKWCIYPSYDWAHGLEDSIENITHSLCTLEFEDHRPLYDWFLNELGVYHPQQIEFSRLNLNYTIMSKRMLAELVSKKLVTGWDDPRMPTISGLRKRGYTPESIKDFIGRVGVSKNEGVVDMALLEHCLRDDLNKKALRFMGVLDPIKVVIDNYPEGQTEELDAINNPEDEKAGKRKLPFSKELYIEKDDFMEDAPKKYWRLTIGREVRLRYAYFIKATSVVKDENGEITEIHCTYDPETKGGNAPDGRKVKSTIHWVSANESVDAEVRIYDRLFSVENPLADKEKDFTEFLNPESLQIIESAKVEPNVKKLNANDTIQFERKGYFIVDEDSTDSKLVFNLAVSLRDKWKKIKNRKQK